MGRLELLLLGPVELHRDSRPVEIGGTKRPLLLALLGLECGRTVAIDELVAALWDEPPRNARHALHELVSSLRSLLDDASISHTSGGYRLDLDPDRVDIGRFRDLAARARSASPEMTVELLRAAVGLRRGPALANCRTTAGARAKATALDEELIAVLAQRFDLELDGGNARAVIPELTALVEAEPLSETFRAQLMRALYLTGRQVDALTVFREGRRVLADDLGVEPGGELRALELAILRHDDGAIARGGYAATTGEAMTYDDAVARAAHVVETWRMAARERDRAAFDHLDATTTVIERALADALAAGDHSVAFRIVGGMWFFWVIRGRAVEMFERLRLLAAAAPATEDEAHGLVGVSELAREAGATELAVDLKRRALSIFTDLAAAGPVAALTSDLAVLTAQRGDDVGAVALAQEALRLRRLDDGDVGVAHALVAVGAVDVLAGRDDAARVAFEHAASAYAAAGRPGEAAFVRVRHLAPLWRKRGDHGVAYAQLRTSLREAEIVGDVSTTAVAKHGLAWVALERHEPMTAVRLLAEGGDETILGTLCEDERAVYRADVERLRAELPPDAFEVAWKIGAGVADVEARSPANGGAPRTH